MTTKKPIGRPSIFSTELASTICARLARGESVRTICKDPKMPCTATVFKWLANGKHLGFMDQYESARLDGLETLAEEILSIADAPVGLTVTGATDSGAVQKQRLQIDTRKWILSKLLPKKYGDLLGLDHKGDGLTLNVVTGVPESFASLEQKRSKNG